MVASANTKIKPQNLQTIQQRTNLPQQKKKGSSGFFFAHRKKETTGGGGGVALNIHDEIKHTSLHGKNTTTFVTKNPKKSSVVTPPNLHHLPPPPLRLFHDGSFTSRSQQKRFYNKNNNTKYSTNQNSKHMRRRLLFPCFSCSILLGMQIRRRKKRRFIKTKTKKNGSPCFLFFSNFSRRACLGWYWTRTKDEWLKLSDRQKKRCRHHRKLPREN